MTGAFERGLEPGIGGRLPEERSEARACDENLRRGRAKLASSDRGEHHGTGLTRVCVLRLDVATFQSQLRDSLLVKLAERGGFEPPVRFNPYSSLANCRFRPLSHLSIKSISSVRRARSATAIVAAPNPIGRGPNHQRRQRRRLYKRAHRSGQVGYANRFPFGAQPGATALRGGRGAPASGATRSGGSQRLVRDQNSRAAGGRAPRQTGSNPAPSILPHSCL